MSLVSNSISIYDFIKFTNSGLEIADFVQIRDAITRRYKDVYGQDIDVNVSPTNADGVFINDLSLIMNNILQSIKTLYANLDVNSASGSFLENLCKLSNVTRKQATSSVAYLVLSNSGSSDIDIVNSYDSNGTIFVDKSGNEWLYAGPTISVPVTTYSGGVAQNRVMIKVASKIVGRISAPATWINQAINEPYLSVEQPEDAIEGLEEESDSELRARRAQSVGATGATVVEALLGELLSLPAISDAKIYNNNTSSTVQAKDGNDVSAHSIYVLLRRVPGISLDESDSNHNGSPIIGNIIYQKLTPGIRTSFGNMRYDVDISDPFVQLVSQEIYWSEVAPSKNSEFGSSLSIRINPFSNFSITTLQLIKTKVCQYLNTLHIGQDIIKDELIIEAMTADPTFNGRPTFSIIDIAGDFTKGILSNPDKCFDLDDVVSTEESTLQSGEYVLKILTT